MRRGGERDQEGRRCLTSRFRDLGREKASVEGYTAEQGVVEQTENKAGLGQQDCDETRGGGPRARPVWVVLSVGLARGGSRRVD